VNKDMTLMVRQLQPTETGLPMQLYFFTDTVVWVDYEGIQSDVFDHVLAVIPEFGLRVFQNPSGEDVASLRNAFFPNAQTPSQTPPQASPQASSQAAPQNAPPLHASRPAAPQRPQAEQPAPEEAKAPASASPE
jgi:small-conductance mechanosensitive channel